jgi:hypothetical protein
MGVRYVTGTILSDADRRAGRLRPRGWHQ